MSYNHVFLKRSIRDINQMLSKRETTVSKLCSESLEVIESNKNLNSFITVCKHEALREAERLDNELIKNPKLIERNPLFGIPVSIKDNLCTRDILTSCGSKMLSNFIPPYTATAVSKLLNSNCLMMGKTNMDEFAMGSSSTTSFYGPTANCYVPTSANPSDWYMAGGSSTGSAVSVASGACFASLGTDTGGSTRQPASLTNIVGFKPTYGLISRFGLVPLAHCLDVVSILARTVEDAQLVFDTIVGQDEHDLTSVDARAKLKSSCIKLCGKDAKEAGTIRVGVPEVFISGGEIKQEVSQRYTEILNCLNKNHEDSSVKFEVLKLDLPYSRLATECYTIIACAEIASNMSCYDGIKYGYSSKTSNLDSFSQDILFKKNRDEGFGLEVKKRILLGNYFLLAGNREKYLKKALQLRRLISEEFAKAFEGQNVDVILTPSTPSTSLSYADWIKKQDDNKLFHEDYFLIPSNLANLPSISLPAGLSKKGLPFGLQLICNKFHDLDLLYMAKFFEKKMLHSFIL